MGLSTAEDCNTTLEASNRKFCAVAMQTNGYDYFDMVVAILSAWPLHRTSKKLLVAKTGPERTSLG